MPKRSARQPPEADRRPAPTLQPQRILLLEDDVDQRESLAEMLERAGYVVDRAVDGPDALELAMLRRPDVILTDLSMPRMDGFEVAHRLHADARTRDIPLIAVTARNISPTAVRMGGPFADVFFKPVDTAEFLAFLRTFLKKPERF